MGGFVQLIVAVFVAVQAPAFAEATAGRPTSAQAPTGQLPRPTFETGVELISVDVHVVDKNGKPIGDLKPDDFEVEIGGRRRRISSVQFVSYAPTGAKGPAATAAPAAPASTDLPRPRRMFVLAVDEHSLHTRNAMAAVTAAERFIDRLQPDDLVGLYAYPTGAAQHDMTTDHAAVRKVLQKVGGLFNEPVNNLNMSSSEIIDCANNDRDCLLRVWQRECSGGSCSQMQVRQEAISLSGLMETMASQSVGGLRGLLRSLKDIPGRKTLVLVSGGLVTTDQAGGRMNLRSEIAAVGRDASLANVNVFALHLDWSFIEAVTNRRGIRTTYFREANMAASGLEAVAGNAGGTVIRVQGTSPDVAFDRVLSETSAHYLLGVESIADDRDGQAHAIRVRVKRGGAQVRSRTFVTIPSAKEKGHVESFETPAPGRGPFVPDEESQADRPSLEQVLSAVARYLAKYEEELSAVVLEERYQQRVIEEPVGPYDLRHLRSDVLLIRDPELEWVGFRDVFEVDGRAVRDRDQRLQRLFLGDRASAMEQVQRIVAESTRYNLNSERVTVQRSVNMPMTALRFLTGENQPRSTFKHGGLKRLEGKPAIVIELTEREKPRIIQTDDDSASSGRVWVDPASGAVMRTELWLEMTNPTYKTSVSVRVRVSFARNDKLGIWLPAEMDEEYRSGRTRITGTASYINPRRFSVATTEKIK